MGDRMKTAKTAIIVEKGKVQEAVRERLEKIKRSRLSREVLKLDPEEERRMAGESFKDEDKLRCRS